MFLAYGQASKRIAEGAVYVLFSLTFVVGRRRGGEATRAHQPVGIPCQQDSKAIHYKIISGRANEKIREIVTTEK
jgi:hypothetical protein